MSIRYAPRFLEKLQKQKVRVRNSFKKAIKEFEENPNSLVLNNHGLEREWLGYRSINITADFRAIYREIKLADETIAYFEVIGTHEELYKPSSKN